MFDLASIEQRYDEPHRDYHSRRHLIELRATLKDWNPPRRELLELFALFHDAIYVPGRSDNEDRSAQLARESLLEYLPADELEWLVQAILATRAHETNDESAWVAIDLDLSPLASPEHLLNAHRIRHEYAALDDIEWRDGRSAFLEGFLNRKSIYLSRYGRPLEEAARANLQRELTLLRG